MIRLALLVLLACAPPRPPMPDAVPVLDEVDARLQWGRERLAYWCGLAWVRGPESCRAWRPGKGK